MLKAIYIALCLIFPLLTARAAEPPPFRWAKASPDNYVVSSLAADSERNCYAVFSISVYSTLTSGFAIDSVFVPSACVLAKFDVNGVCQWARPVFPASASTDARVAVASDGSLIVAATLYTWPEQQNRLALARFAADGAELWSATFEPEERFIALDLALDASDNIFISASKKEEALVLSYNSSGEPRWRRGAQVLRPLHWDIFERAYWFRISVSPGGNVFVIGQLGGVVTFGPWTNELLGATGVFVAKYSNDGDFEWVAFRDRAHPTDIVAIDDDNCRITGLNTDQSEDPPLYFGGFLARAGGGVIADFKMATRVFDAQPTALALSPDGSLFIVGSRLTQTQPFQTLLPFINAYSSPEEVLWSYESPLGPAHASFEAVAANSQGDIFIAGETGTRAFLGDLIVGSGYTTPQPFIAKLNSVPAPPTVRRHPRSQSLQPGATLKLDVLAAGDGPLSYQWYRGNSPIENQRAPTLIINAATEADSGEYFVLILNAVGETLTLPAIVTVASRPTLSILLPDHIDLSLNEAPFLGVPGEQIEMLPNGGAIGGGSRLQIFEPGLLDRTLFPAVFVKSPILVADGKLYARFGIIGAWSGNIQRIDLDGSRDFSFNTPVSGLAEADALGKLLLQPDGKLLVGATATGNTPALIRVNTDGSLGQSFALNGLSAEYVADIKLTRAGKILVAGKLSYASAGGVARLNADGSLDPSFASALSQLAECYAVAETADGKILVGGNFPQHLVQLSSDGSLDASFTANAPDPVHTVALQTNGRIVTGGPSAARRYFPDGALDLSFQPQTASSYTITLDSFDRIHIASRQKLVRYSGHLRVLIPPSQATLVLEESDNVASGWRSVRTLPPATEVREYINSDFPTAGAAFYRLTLAR